MSDVLVRRAASNGRLTLNRPATQNALTLPMVREIDAALAGWQVDDGVATILIDAEGERAFCAGGDIRAIYNAAKTGRWDEAAAFFAEEYRLNARIAAYPKPIVSLMHGTTMGGGIGLGSHASHRVVTERSVLAMPEARIGFYPDVGGTFLLSRAPGELGTHVGLSAGRLVPGDAIACGLADHYLRSERIADLRLGLESCRSAADIERLLSSLGERAEPGPLATARPWIDRCYAGDSAERIVAALRDAQEVEARQAADAIEGNSPTSVKVTLRAMRNARRGMSLEACLDQEFRITLSCIRDPDFLEGVRAAVIDKDRAPIWHPARLDEVSIEAVARHFAPTPVNRLGLSKASQVC